MDMWCVAAQEKDAAEVAGDDARTASNLEAAAEAERLWKRHYERKLEEVGIT